MMLPEITNKSLYQATHERALGRCKGVLTRPLESSIGAYMESIRGLAESRRCAPPADQDYFSSKIDLYLAWIDATHQVLAERAIAAMKPPTSPAVSAVSIALSNNQPIDRR